MPELTALELEQMRRDLVDLNTPPAFPDAELQELWVFNGEDWNKSVVHAIDRLMMSASKQTDYTQNQTSEKKSQLLTNLKIMREIWQKKVDKAAEAVEKTKQRGVVLTRLRPGWGRKSGPYA